MTIPNGLVTIIGDVANINYYLITALSPDSLTGIVDKTSNVKSYTRRAYAGDPNPVNVSGSTREWMYDPGRRNGAAIPGNPFILDDGYEKRSFMYIGNLVNLHAFLAGNAKMNFTLYSQSAAYDIAKTEQEG